MKNNKGMIILLVGLAALTLVVVVGLIFFYPKDPAVAKPSPQTVAAPVAEASPLPSEFDPVEWTRNPQAAPIEPKTSPAPTANTGFVVAMPSASPAVKQPLPPGPGVAFPDEPTPTPAAPKTIKKPAVVKATPTPKAKRTVTVTEYWVQVGSFKDRYQAENSAKSLEAEGLKGSLSTATVNGQSVVRVRLGPYANQAEAEKFLAWVKPVKGLEGSYVTVTKGQHLE